MIEIQAQITTHSKVSVLEISVVEAMEKILLNSVGLWVEDYINDDNIVMRPSQYNVSHVVRKATEQDAHVFRLIKDIKTVYYTKPRTE